VLGNGDGTFRAPLSPYAGGFQSKALAVADLDSDGRPDVVTASSCAHTGLCPNGSAGVLLNSGKFETTTTITSSLNPSIYGQSVILTATVVSIGSATPTGKVTFRNSNVPIGSAVLSAGVATLETTHLPAGTLSITATYTGDTQSGKSTSAPLSQTVKQASTTTTVKSSLNPSSQGQAVTFTAQVTSPTTKVTGAVTFSTGNSTLGTVALSGGKAAITTSTLPAGNNTITAAYAGTANIVGSVASLIQAVN
jgi:Big-like domain-containing protein